MLLLRVLRSARCLLRSHIFRVAGPAHQRQAAAILQKAEVPLIDNATYNAPEAYHGQILSGMMCAAYRDGGILPARTIAAAPDVARRRWAGSGRRRMLGRAAPANSAMGYNPGRRL
jgi:hypothetical protein